MRSRSSNSKPAPRKPALHRYRSKRDFSKTREPAGGNRSRAPRLIFVIQEHHARRLHYDLRLEAQGVLKSWAVTNEPSLDASVRRLAIETEDHPLEYARFAGEIPAGEYGAGRVKIWDHGTYHSEKPVESAEEIGHIDVILHGRKLKGRFVLVRISGEGERSHWLFFKAREKPAGLRIPTRNSRPTKRRSPSRAG